MILLCPIYKVEYNNYIKRSGLLFKVYDARIAKPHIKFVLIFGEINSNSEGVAFYPIHLFLFKEKINLIRKIKNLDLYKKVLEMEINSDNNFVFSMNNHLNEFINKEIKD